MRNIGSNATAATTILNNLSSQSPAVAIKAVGGELTSTVLSNSVNSPSTIYFTESGIMLAGYLVAEGLSTNQRKVIDHLGSVVTVQDNADTANTGIQFDGTIVTINANGSDGEIHLVSDSGVFIGSGTTNAVATQSWVTAAINTAASEGGYILPTAATNTKGGIKVDGTIFTVNSQTEKIALTGYSVASGTSGAITIGGTSSSRPINIGTSSSGTISFSAGHVQWGSSDLVTEYSLSNKGYITAATMPVASTNATGGIKVDGTTTTMDNGVLKINGLTMSGGSVSINGTTAALPATTYLGSGRTNSDTLVTKSYVDTAVQSAGSTLTWS